MDSAKIFIDTDNEITFILEKILDSRQDRVCLVVPDRASIFTSISSLKLIKRVVDKSNKLMILVTLDEHGAELARKVGFIVVSRVGEINEDLWEKLQKNKFELIKKRSKRIFYTPETQVQQKTEDVIENSSILHLSKVISEDLVQADLKFEELRKQDNKVPQISINIENEEIKSLKQDKLKEKEMEVSQYHDPLNDFNLQSKKVEETNEVSNISRFRTRKSTSKANRVKIIFVEGYDLRCNHGEKNNFVNF